MNRLTATALAFGLLASCGSQPQPQPAPTRETRPPWEPVAEAAEPEQQPQVVPGTPTPSVQPTLPEAGAKPATATPTPQETAAMASVLAREGLVRASLPNGMLAVLASEELATAGLAEVQMGLFAGARNGRPGIADLAAELLVGAGNPLTGRVSLRQWAESVGGTVTVDVGPLTTWIGVRVPAREWQSGLDAMAASLQESTASRTQLERLRIALVQRDTDFLVRDPVGAFASRFLLGDLGMAAHVVDLLERDVSDAILFQARHYRPDRTVISVRSDADLAAAGKAALGAFGTWRGSNTTPDPEFGPHPRRLPDGLFWAPGGTISRLLLVFPLPEPLGEEDVAQHVLQACVTLDGIGGRLERLQIESGLGTVTWESRFVHGAESSAIVLSATVSPEQAVALVTLARRARESLQLLPPNSSELALASSRAQLSLRTHDRGGLRRLRAQVVRGLGNTSLDDLSARAAAMSSTTSRDWTASIAALVAQPICAIVLGGTPPEGTAYVPFDILPPIAAPAAQDAAVAAATPRPTEADGILQNSISQVGGAERLQRMVGYESRAMRSAVNAPDVREFLLWRKDGTIVRKRTAMGTEVITEMSGDKAVERVGENVTELPAAEALACKRQASRHPVALLAAAASGLLELRTAATRNDNGRKIVVLEASGTAFDRLRMHVDATSGLPLVVESWDTDPNGSPTFLREEWSDWRQCGGIRVPFHCVTDIDDGAIVFRSDTVQWQPLW